MPSGNAINADRKLRAIEVQLLFNTDYCLTLSESKLKETFHTVLLVLSYLDLSIEYKYFILQLKAKVACIN